MEEMPTAVEVNCETNETIVRPLTAEEIAEREAQAQAFAKEQAEREAEANAIAAAKEAAHAKLAAVGLTPDEIAALSK